MISQAAAEAIQRTNDASIVSKLSVESKGYKLFGHRRYLRHVVDKPAKRTAQINYGYYVRMKCIEDAVMRFSKHSTENTTKIVVNLGCGFDLLPLEWLSTESPLSFIDVDFEHLIGRKEKLLRIMAREKGLEHVAEWLQQGKYRLVGCDLNNIGQLKTLLEQACPDYATSQILFISEVALTYMDTSAADAIIEWTASLQNAHFALIEQIIPGGPDHPFARQMLKHFTKLQSPLKSVLRYRNKQSQMDRFRCLGWKTVHATSLYDFYNAESLEQPSHVEGYFDEWEELALFLHHYCYVFAGRATSQSHTTASSSTPTTATARLTKVKSNFAFRTRNHAIANFSQSLISNGGKDTSGDIQISICLKEDPIVNTNPSLPLQFHTFTSTKHGPILVGGRRHSSINGKAQLLSNTELSYIDKDSTRLVPRYRHSAACVDGSSVLICGGRSAKGVEKSWQLWTLENGWSTLEIQGERPCPRHSATLVWDSASNLGLLSGGLDANGRVCDDVWTIRFSKHLIFTKWNLDDVSRKLVARFGAKAVEIGPDTYLLAGGVGPNVLSWDEQFIQLCFSSETVCRVQVDCHTQEPILIGHAVSIFNGHCIITGGSCVCFSFGSSENEQLVTLTYENSPVLECLQLRKHSNFEAGEAAYTESLRVLKVTSIDEANVSDHPLLLQSLNIGSCKDLWNPTYLIEKVGEDREVPMTDFVRLGNVLGDCSRCFFIQYVFHQT